MVYKYKFISLLTGLWIDNIDKNPSIFVSISISIIRTEKQIKFEQTNKFYHLIFSASNRNWNWF